MKRVFCKKLAVVLSLVLFFSSSNGLLQAFAVITSCVDYFDDGEYSSNQGQYVANIAEAQLGKDESDLPYSYDWCSFFATDCAWKAGVSSSVVPQRGYAHDLVEFFMRDSYSKVYFRQESDYFDGSFLLKDFEPQPGDIIGVCNDGNRNTITNSNVDGNNSKRYCVDHIGLVWYTDETNGWIYTIEGNTDDSVNSYRYRWNNSDSNGQREWSSSTYIQYVCHPAYSDSDPDPIYADLGDEFYAVILNKACWKPISLNTTNNKITLESEKNVAYQKWRFLRQDDGAYAIESCQNGKVLEMTNGTREVCSQLSAHDDWWGGAYQQWYLIPFNDGYIFQSKHFTSEDWVMDLYAGDDSDGNVIQINHRNYNDAQTWSVYTGDDVQLKAPTLTVQPGTDSTKTVFTWDSVYGSTRYDVKIWKDHVDHSVSSYHTEWGASFGYSIQLPPGTYEAYVTASDYYQCLGSQDVQFTVQGDTPADTPVDLGEDFYAVILSNEIWKPIGNDHATDNFVRLQTGEHEKSSAHQLWRFQRQSDGSYAIRSTQDGHCLEFYRGVREENNPVSAGYDWWNGAYQKWWIYQNSDGGYFFESDHYTSEGWYMTLKDNNSADGTPITMCRFTGQNNQVWGIYGTSEVQMKAPTLTVDANTASEATEFSWDHVFGAKEFQVKIWENQYDETKSPDYTETVTTTNSSIQLPAGDYEASVTASNYWQSYTSQIIHFTVDEETYPVTVTGITVQTLPSKTAYGIGDTLDTTGLTLTATKSDGTSETVTTGFICTPTTLNTVGTQTIMVSYGGQTTTFDVTVHDLEIPEDAPRMMLSKEKARAGERVDVTLSIDNNPGIIATSVNLTYDNTILRLVEVKDGNLFGATSFSPGNDLTAVPYTVVWVDGLVSQDFTANGVMATFTFEVLEDAPVGETTITLNYVMRSTFNVGLNEVSFALANGSINVTDRTPGDVNNDGVVNLKDVVILRRFLAGGWDVTIDESNSDVNNDQIIDLKDTTLIVRYLAGGWDVTLL